MPLRQVRTPCRSLLLASAALVVTASCAAAADLPATSEGSDKIKSFLETYAGSSAAGAATAISMEDNKYLVSVDLAAILTALKNAGISYDPAIVKYNVVEQDNDQWRVEQSEFPPVTSHMKRGDTTFDTSMALTGLQSVFVIDPSISWIRSGQFSIGTMALHGRTPGVTQELDVRALQGDSATTVAADGAVMTNIRETIESLTLAMTVDMKAAEPDAHPDAKPVDVSAKAGQSDASVKLGTQPRPLLDLWAFLVAHPSRSELASAEPAFKTLLNAALAAPTAIGEDLGTQKLSVLTPKGAFLCETAKTGFDVAAAGPASSFEQRFAVTGLTLPPGLTPPAYQDFIPTSFDLGYKVTGFDLTAAGTELVADMHLAGDGPIVSDEDRAKASAKLHGAGPIVIDIPSSQIRAPQLDAGFEGQIRYDGGKPTGKITLHMRDFDKSVAALKALGPDTERQMVPVVAMMKGLAKTEANGVLTWVGEVGADGVMKVNGLPIGKAPF